MALVSATANRAPTGRSSEALGLRITANKLAEAVVPLVFGAVGASFGLLPVFWSNALFLLAGGGLTASRPIGAVEGAERGRKVERIRCGLNVGRRQHKATAEMSPSKRLGKKYKRVVTAAAVESAKQRALPENHGTSRQASLQSVVVGREA